MDLCRDVNLAKEVTLQPIEILDVDAAILFSDILVVPLEMGLGLEFSPTIGPRFTQTIRSESNLANLQKDAHKRLDYVYDAISSIRAELDKTKALIGFCGAPWTLATYIIEGQGSKTYAHSKKMLYRDPALLRGILERLTTELKGYLAAQIRAGADAVMIFDSWAGALEREAYFAFGFCYIEELAKAVKRDFPNTPIIVFPKGVGGFLEAFSSVEKNFEVFGIDWATSLENAKKILGENFVLQGNLEPCRLYDAAEMERGVDEIVRIMGKNGGHIFNLGHGMLPDLPRENAIKLVQMVREKTRR